MCFGAVDEGTSVAGRVTIVFVPARHDVMNDASASVDLGWSPTPDVPTVDGLLRLDGTVALVTGARKGIGAAIAARLTEAGAAVVSHDRSMADLRSEPAIVELVGSVIAQHGRLDLLVNNAADQALGSVTSLGADEWSDLLASNLVAPSLLMREFAATCRAVGRGGAIVNLSSVEAFAMGQGHVHYGASKAALLHLTRAAAREFAVDGIRVNAVCPGLIWSPGIDEGFPQGVARWLDHAPMKRLGQATDVADAVLFLGSRAARFITGASLTVDGGLTGGWEW
jgi:NAD(P)-dependent dehydrogenase (short-subunit alcohol dehydrogenase family)